MLLPAVRPDRPDPDTPPPALSRPPASRRAPRCGADPREYAPCPSTPRAGAPLGQDTFPRPQGATEHCTVHDDDIVPTAKGDVLVACSHQSGISVVDLTDPANAEPIACADPAPLDPNALVRVGDWSTCWYDGFSYESGIRRGLIVWRLNDPAVACALEPCALWNGAVAALGAVVGLSRTCGTTSGWWRAPVW